MSGGFNKSIKTRSRALEVLKIDPDFSVDRIAKVSPLPNEEKLERVSDCYGTTELK